MKRFLFGFFTAVLATLPTLALAHERWFVQELHGDSLRPLFFSEWNFINGTMVTVALILLIIIIVAHNVLHDRLMMGRLQTFLGRYAVWTPILVRTFTGLLLFSASFSYFLFAPELTVKGINPGGAQLLLMIELVIGLGLVSGILPRLMSFLGILLYFATFFIFPPLEVLSYIGILGALLYILINSDASLPVLHKEKYLFATALAAAKPYALPLLRITTGLSFIIVGAYYKIFDPRYSLEFLKMHPINFMQMLGFTDFSNEMFVLAAGLVEVSLGILLVLGVFPRILGLLLFGLLSTTLIIFGLPELLGHLPIFAVAFALITSPTVSKS